MIPVHTWGSVRHALFRTSSLRIPWWFQCTHEDQWDMHSLALLRLEYLDDSSAHMRVSETLFRTSSLRIPWWFQCTNEGQWGTLSPPQRHLRQWALLPKDKSLLKGPSHEIKITSYCSSVRSSTVHGFKLCVFNPFYFLRLFIDGF